MLVREEDAADRRELELRQHHLPPDAIAAVDDVRGAVDHDDLRGGRAVRLGRRTASGPEEDQARLGLCILGEGAREGERRDQRRTCTEEAATGDWRFEGV